MSNDFIPRTDADYHNFFKNITSYVTKQTIGVPTAWTHIPMEDRTDLIALQAEWETAYLTTLVPHNPELTKEKNRVRTRTERALRAFINRFLRWPPVTDLDRDNMGIPNKDLIRTPHIDVTEAVALRAELRHIREIAVHFWVDGMDNKAKPSGYEGAVLIWDVLDTPPTRPSDLKRHTMASRTPYILEFDETERGKTVYIAASWQNERGHIGQWSGIISAIVP